MVPARKDEKSALRETARRTPTYGLLRRVRRMLFWAFVLHGVWYGLSKMFPVLQQRWKWLFDQTVGPMIYTQPYNATAKGWRPSATKHLSETANLMDQIYTMLADMTYIPARAIKRGPHQINRTLTVKYELDPLVVELMEMLPYVNREEVFGYNEAWFFGGEFTDFRDEEDFEQGRDPMYSNWEYEGLKGKWDVEGGEYVRPWITPLTRMGNHQSVLFYDARDHRIWLFETEGWFAHDLDFQSFGSPTGSNGFVFDGLPSFSATAFLKEVLRRYRTLELMPWGASHGGYDKKPEQDIKDLYWKNGWPDHFNGDQFRADMLTYDSKRKWFQNGRAIGKAGLFLRAIEELEGIEVPGDERASMDFTRRPGFIEWSETTLAEKQNNLLSTQDADEQWKLKWIIHQTKWRLEDARKRLRTAKAEVEKLCPSGVCVPDDELILWEFQAIEEEYDYAKERFEAQSPVYASEEPLTLPSKEALEYRWAKLAYDELKAALNGRQPLPKGQEMRTQEWNRLHYDNIARNLAYLSDIENWRDGLPIEAVSAREAVELDIKSTHNEIERSRQIIAQWERYEASKGDRS